MEAGHFFKTSGSLCHSTQRQILEDSNIYCSLITLPINDVSTCTRNF